MFVNTKDAVVLWEGGHFAHVNYSSIPEKIISREIDFEEEDVFSFCWEKNKVSQLDFIQSLLRYLDDRCVICENENDLCGGHIGNE